MENVVLRARGLEKIYDAGEAGVVAIQGLDLDIHEGEYTVVMGSSGSGKSTLLFLLSGLDRVSAGSIEFAGQRIEGLDETRLARLRREGFGFVFQAINLVGNLSVMENILAAGYLGSATREGVRDKATELLKLLDIAELADRLPAQVSGGQQQRAAVARALINQPRILFADEPTGALNWTSGQALLDCLDKVSRAGQTILMVTHDLRSACRGERIVFLRDGKVGGEYHFAEAGLAAAPQAEREKALFAWLQAMGW
jgi:putative ABC transport system ATP-binding protein